MVQIEIEDHVQLIQDLPELGLHRGDVGIVCSTWFWPSTTYEVEFGSNASSQQLRALLTPNQIEPSEPVLMGR